MLLEKAAPDSRRPRKLDAATWDQLGVQSGHLETSRIVLMRACLRLLARSSDQGMKKEQGDGSACTHS